MVAPRYDARRRSPPRVDRRFGISRSSVRFRYPALAKSQVVLHVRRAGSRATTHGYDALTARADLLA